MVFDTQMLPQVTQESSGGRPVTSEVDTDGRRSTLLRAIKKIGLTLKVGPTSGFPLNKEHTSPLALVCAAGIPDCKSFLVKEEARSVHAPTKSSPTEIGDTLDEEASGQATLPTSSPPKLGDMLNAAESVRTTSEAEIALVLTANLSFKE